MALLFDNTKLTDNMVLIVNEYIQSCMRYHFLTK